MIGRRVTVWLPTGLYLASLFMPVIEGPFWRSDRPERGYEAFSFGFRAAFKGHDEEVRYLQTRPRVELAAAWFAYPVMWMAFGCCIAGCRRGTIIAAGLASVLCVPVLPTFWDSAITEFPGYWCWWN